MVNPKAQPGANAELTRAADLALDVVCIGQQALGFAVGIAASFSWADYLVMACEHDVVSIT